VLETKRSIDSDFTEEIDDLPVTTSTDLHLPATSEHINVDVEDTLYTFPNSTIQNETEICSQTTVLTEKEVSSASEAPCSENNMEPEAPSWSLERTIQTEELSAENMIEPVEPLSENHREPEDPSSESDIELVEEPCSSKSIPSPPKDSTCSPLGNSSGSNYIITNLSDNTTETGDDTVSESNSPLKRKILEDLKKIDLIYSAKMPKLEPMVDPEPPDEETGPVYFVEDDDLMILTEVGPEDLTDEEDMSPNDSDECFSSSRDAFTVDSDDSISDDENNEMGPRRSLRKRLPNFKYNESTDSSSSDDDYGENSQKNSKQDIVDSAAEQVKQRGRPRKSTRVVQEGKSKKMEKEMPVETQKPERLGKSMWF